MPGRFLLLVAFLLLGVVGAAADAAEEQGRHRDYSRWQRHSMKQFNCDPVSGFNSKLGYSPFINLDGDAFGIGAYDAFVCEKKQADAQTSYQLVVDASPIKELGWQTWHPFGACPDVIHLNAKPGGLSLSRHGVSNRAEWWFKLSDHTVALADSILSQCLPNHEVPMLFLETGKDVISYTCINGEWYFND